MIIVAITTVLLTNNVPTQVQAEAQIDDDGDDNLTLSHIRASVLASGEIPSHYLITKRGDTWVEHFGGVAAIQNYERITRDTLATGADTNSKQQATELSLTGMNFYTLAENPGLDLDEVAALQLQTRVLDGTYILPHQEPIRRYHAFLLNHYDLPTTADGVDDRLNDIVGEMASLTSIILDTYEKWALRGVVNPELDQQDTFYWIAITHLFKCEYEGEDDCTSEREYLETERWNDNVEFIPPPNKE